MESNQVMVSVCCLVYNHEKYLRQCLDGFIMQKTDFKFEVLIHDDASTDHSADIIREYERKYPDIIKPIYQTENQYSRGVKISFKFQYPRVSGKYIAFCEGDDFWTDPLKLQTQFDELENNPDCSFCAHIVRSVSEAGEKLDETHPKGSFAYKTSRDGMIRLLLSDKPYQFQTSSYFFRSEVILEHLASLPKFITVASVGDAPLMMLASTKGNIIFIDKEMSCYRKASVGSWSCRFRDNQEFRITTIQRGIDSFRAFDDFTNYKYSVLVDEVCCREEFKLLQAKKEYRKMLHKKYRTEFHKQTLKERMFVFCKAYFPRVMGVYGRLKHEK